MGRSSFFLTLVHLCLALLLCTLQVGSAQAQPARNLITIQGMIDAALEGSTVNIPDGIYYETLVINKTITLVGESAKYTVLRPALSTDRVINVAAGKDLRLETLTVTGGHPLGAVGGGILMNDGNLTLVGCWIKDNSADYGGAIFQEGASKSVTDSGSLIFSNTATHHGGAIFARGSISLTNTTFSLNTAGWHGGAVHVDSGSTQVTSVIFQENHATSGNGGGLNVNNNLNISGATFIANTAGDSGGGLTQWNSAKTVVIQNTTFTSNTAKVKGGGAYVGSYFTLTSSTFTTNVVDSGDTRNSAGGGVYANDGVNASQVTFIQNTATCPPWNGGTGCTSSQGGGMAIHRLVAGGNSIVTQSLFEGNRSWNGSGLSSATGVQLFVASSRFQNNGLNCYHATYHANLCGYGSGIDASWLDGNTLTFENNYASNAGGAISAATLSLANSKFISNRADSSDGGGAIRAQVVNGVNLLFGQNIASNGAAVKIEATSPLTASTLKHITIANPARQTGTAIYVSSGGALNLQNSIVSSYATGANVAGTLTEDYNLYSDNNVDIGSSGTLISGGHSFTSTDARFFNRSASNYHLRWGSPAMGRGTNLGVTLDLDGQPRTTRIDIGAYQAQARFLPTIIK